MFKTSRFFEINLNPMLKASAGMPIAASGPKGRTAGPLRGNFWTRAGTPSPAIRAEFL